MIDRRALIFLFLLLAFALSLVAFIWAFSG